MFHSRKRSLAKAAVGLALTLSAVAACSSDPSQGGGTPGAGSGAGNGTLNVYLYQKPKVFSPLAPNNGPDQIVMSLVFDSLVAPDTDFELQPRMAQELPQQSADGTTYTFKLRPGLKWSDGQPFTAQDVLFTYNLMANPKAGAASAGNYAGVEGVDALAAGTAPTASGFSAPDDNTFVIKTTKPDAGIVALIGATPILPKHVLGAVPVDQVAKNAFFSKPTAGTGPYRFISYQTDQYVELQANPEFRTPVGISRVFLKPVTSDVATAQLGTGEMDVVQVSPTDLPTVEKMGNVTVTAADSPGFTRIAVNQAQPRFADPRVRQALMYAIDRKKIVDSVLGGKASVPATSFMGDVVPDNLNKYEYNPQKAKDLLAQAGWDSSKPVELEWVPGQRDRDTTATIVQSQLQEVGVKVELKQVQAAQLLESYTGGYDLAMFGGGTYTDPSQVPQIVGCDKFYPTGSNVPHFCDKTLDELTGKANATADAAARQDLYRQAAARENEQAAYLWMYNPQTVWASNTRVQGFKASGDITRPFSGIENWHLN
ncbi:ABC transporter substrate-binding protein [Streptomycetaceae bacterium NBC_01309]